MLKSVRSKLYALVLLGALTATVALLVLAWTMRIQLVDMVDDRMPIAVAGLEAEIVDDVADAEAAARALDESTELVEATRAGDATAAARELVVFHDFHPDFDLLVFRNDGSLLAQVGCTAPPTRLQAIHGLPPVPTHATGSVRAVVANGCESTGNSAAPAFLIATRLEDVGFVVICLPIDDAFVEDVAAKIGAELAAIDPNADDVRARTDRFPLELFGHARGSQRLVDDRAGRTWAIKRVDPDALLGESDVALVAALDVTRVREIVNASIGVACLVVLVFAVAGLLLGARIARAMSEALSRVSLAMRKLEHDEYMHVTGVRTGDELEDLASGFNVMVDGLQERDKLRSTFGKYMTQTVMEHLLSGKVQLGGESLSATILFTDIRSFTTISEKMEPHALVSLLNEYFTEMVAIIIQEDGVVDKYIGDAIMAVFGAPVPKQDDALRAVRAAVRMRTALAALNERLAVRGIAPIRTGVGVHTGPVVAGNIGSEARMEYTVIGDSVNLASRLESATKDLGEDIVISEDTYELVRDAIVARPLQRITVKGRAAPVLIYAVDAIVDSETIEPLPARAAS